VSEVSTYYFANLHGTLNISNFDVGETKVRPICTALTINKTQNPAAANNWRLARFAAAASDDAELNLEEDVAAAVVLLWPLP
jgi:hypothetical protein